ncbi:glycosyltransferase [Xenophilus sp. Marseille-Q4582]|uniref:glycosyltransferase n=1 Tax=Xenophilus sp. Marseille-Q4582 TaxID=2866600 RepID=UPI001CE4219F|nr:glycosyltransferase [Xenophilus sp. Marseille-Q4582]
MTHTTNKRLLVIAPFCSLPGEAYFNRFLYLAQRAAARCEVTLVTSAFRHFDKRQRDRRVQCEGLRLILIDEPGYAGNVSLARLRSHAVFVRHLKQWLQDELPRRPFDLVYSALPLLQTNILLGRLKERHGFRLAIDVQDLWPEAISALLPWASRLPRPLMPFAAKADRAYGAADHLVAVSRTYLARARQANRQATGQVVYIGSDKARIDAVAARALPAGSMHFVYAGTLGHSYDLQTLVDAFAGLAGPRLPCQLHILGDGPLRARLARRAPPNVHFHGFVPYDEMIAIAKGADCLVNPIKQAAQQSVTNKLSDYLMLGKPIISSQTNAEVRQLLAQAPAVQYRAGHIASFHAAVDAVRALRHDGSVAPALLRQFDRRLSYAHIDALIDGTPAQEAA